MFHSHGLPCPRLRLVLLAHLHSMNNVLFWIFASDEVRALTPECSPQQNVFAPIVLYTVAQACFLGQVSVYQFLLWVPHLVAVVSDAFLRSRGAPEVEFLLCPSKAWAGLGSLWLVCVLAPLVVSFLWTPLRTRASSTQLNRNPRQRAINGRWDNNCAREAGHHFIAKVMILNTLLVRMHIFPRLRLKRFKNKKRL